MNRRALTLAAVSAAAAGAGFAFWRSGREAGEGAALWASTFPTLDGTTLAMRTLRGKPLLLNFWATWCPPCVIEMPMLDGFARVRTDWNVLALAVDAAGPVRRFVSERNLRLPVALARDAGPELARQLGNVSGGLPFSVAFDSVGQVAARKLGALDEGLLAQWAAVVR